MKLRLVYYLYVITHFFTPKVNEYKIAYFSAHTCVTISHDNLISWRHLLRHRQQLYRTGQKFYCHPRLEFMSALAEICNHLIREAAKKLFFLVIRPLKALTPQIHKLDIFFPKELISFMHSHVI